VIHLIGYSEKADSFRDTVNSKRYGFLQQLAFRLGENTQIRYDLKWTRTETNFDPGVVPNMAALLPLPNWSDRASGYCLMSAHSPASAVSPIMMANILSCAASWRATLKLAACAIAY
jgi:hypothetical protein